MRPRHKTQHFRLQMFFLTTTLNSPIAIGHMDFLELTLILIVEI